MSVPTMLHHVVKYGNPLAATKTLCVMLTKVTKHQTLSVTIVSTMEPNVVTLLKKLVKTKELCADQTTKLKHI
jgi:hypothetical protein